MKKKILVNEFRSSLLKALKGKKKPLFLHEPFLNSKDRISLNDCLRSNKVSTAGIFTKKFENEIKRFTKSKYVLTVINGTSALHLAIIALGIKKKEEILIPSLTFVATGHAVLYNHSIPHFFDVNENLTVDILKLDKYLKKITINRNGKCINKKSKRVIRAIIPMHTFGHVCEMDKLKKLATKYNLLVIEDAAEALGSFYKKKHAGTFGDIGVLSFNGNKIITTGMGGAILTKSKKFFDKAKHIAATSKVKKKWEYVHDQLGYNYRLPSINASIGLSQMKRINFFLKKKRNLFKKYKKEFSKLNFLKIFEEQKNIKANYWLQTIVLKKNYENLLNSILKKCHQEKILIRPSWKPLHQLNHFKKFPKMNLDSTNSLAKRIINLPSSSFL